MREALNILGFGPCHHMLEVHAHEEQELEWRALARGAAPDWDRLFAGYRSCVDWPSAYYWRELIDVYPKARVILTYRSPESWWASFGRTIVEFIAKCEDPDHLAVTVVRNRVFGGEPDNREKAIALYEANVKAVKETVPADRLLVYELGTGWEPLCAHLNVRVPDRPFPSRNSADQFRERFEN